MAKIMMGIATLFIGERITCESIAQTMQDHGQQVRVESVTENDVFNVL